MVMLRKLIALLVGIVSLLAASLSMELTKLAAWIAGIKTPQQQKKVDVEHPKRLKADQPLMLGDPVMVGAEDMIFVPLYNIQATSAELKAHTLQRRLLQEADKKIAHLVKMGVIPATGCAVCVLADIRLTNTDEKTNLKFNAG